MRKRKVNTALARIGDTPLVLADLIDKHYHNEEIHEREDFSDLLNFATPRMYFGLALRDALKCNMSLSVREQVKQNGAYYTMKV